MVADLASEAPPPEILAELEIPQGLPPVLVDPQQMRQVLENVITIAYQATPTGGKPTVGARSGRREVSV